MHTTPLPPSPRFFQLALLAVGLAFSAGACAQLPPPSIRPDSGPWDSGAGFHFDLAKNKLQKTRQSVSGLACNLDAKQQRICLMVFDEGAQARYAYVGDKVLTLDAEPVVLRATDGELDAEGAATDGRYFYVTGSHSAKRGDCASNADSRQVLRFRLDPATGRALRSPAGSASGALVDYADTGRLWSIMQAQPELAPHVGERKCLGSEPPPKAPTLAGQQGVNIEGLAVRDGRLYFGFRGPVLNGVAKVLAVDADALFGNEASRDPKAIMTSLALGQQRGIRDMIAVKTGFLLLAGPDDSSSSQGLGWTVSWWDGKGAEKIAGETAKGRAGVVQPRLLAALDLSDVKLRKCDKELKPEAMTLLEETPAAYKLLVLSDGMCDGGPLVFTLAR
ncbi:MAG: DUF3616 domain-containing protein [Polaromonas sp.]